MKGLLHRAIAYVKNIRKPLHERLIISYGEKLEQKIKYSEVQDPDDFAKKLAEHQTLDRMTYLNGLRGKTHFVTDLDWTLCPLLRDYKLNWGAFIGKLTEQA